MDLTCWEERNHTVARLVTSMGKRSSKEMSLRLIEIGGIGECFGQWLAGFELFEPGLEFVFDDGIVSQRATCQFQRSTR